MDKPSAGVALMNQLSMQFEEMPGHTNPSMPLIYLWEIIDSNGLVCCRYVGKASLGAHRPRTQYCRNVNNLLQGKPYRKGKPDAFRKIHHRMAAAVKAGACLRLSFLCNIAPHENINELERFWQSHFGLTNGLAP